MTEPVLEFKDVSKRYDQDGAGDLVALRSVSFAVPAGRKIAVTGRSGSGKSTLLHLAAGIDVPTRGEVAIEGIALSTLGEGERTRIRRDTVGLVFQFFHLLAHLSVLDNVMLPAWIAGGRDREALPRARDLLARVGLEARARSTVQQLSGGEMQRVAICRALLRKPRLLLADEPTGNLDDENGRRVMDLLLRLADEERSALVFVTHSLDLASLADETWRLASGVLERP